MSRLLGNSTIFPDIDAVITNGPLTFVMDVIGVWKKSWQKKDFSPPKEWKQVLVPIGKSFS